MLLRSMPQDRPAARTATISRSDWTPSGPGALDVMILEADEFWAD
ncbi:hypothetical protein [Brachybacterium fresconis]|uniref:Uncharacterized protein n=1 Tax=Brachybacterium fresconis TaxID=173363 RepID=A0ABS4YNA3_9MICO|nr:hypothetical protein [Brachybacterium fresconis]MBP2410266.1 hypothetical protein [Brachybacterium fresconis]